MKFKVTKITKVGGRFGSYNLYTLQSGQSIQEDYSHHAKLKVGDIVNTHHKDCYSRLHDRLGNIGIRIQLMGNFPWVYLEKVNGIKIEEVLHARHGFCIGYSTDMRNITYRKEMFSKIREVLSCEKT